MKLIDECIRIQFDFMGESIDLSRDLVVEQDRVEYRDKFPHILPDVPPKEKHEVLKKLIREGWPTGTQVAAKWVDENCLCVKFSPPNAVGEGR